MKINRILAAVGLVVVLGYSVPSIAETSIFEKIFQEKLALAEQGNADAQNALGGMYDEGLGTRQDYAQARKWIQKAADQGNATAQHNLGSMYDDGVGGTQDKKKAKEYFGQACDNGLKQGCDKYRMLNIGY